MTAWKMYRHRSPGEPAIGGADFLPEAIDAARRGNHINGIDGFWGYAKTRLARFRGMNPNTFYLHLNECEFRFNHRHENIYKVMLTLCRQTPPS